MSQPNSEPTTNRCQAKSRNGAPLSGSLSTVSMKRIGRRARSGRQTSPRAGPSSRSRWWRSTREPDERAGDDGAGQHVGHVGGDGISRAGSRDGSAQGHPPRGPRVRHGVAGGPSGSARTGDAARPPAWRASRAAQRLCGILAPVSTASASASQRSASAWTRTMFVKVVRSATRNPPGTRLASRIQTARAAGRSSLGGVSRALGPPGAASRTPGRPSRRARTREPGSRPPLMRSPPGYERS